MDDLTVAPGALRDAASAVERSVDDLAEARRRLDSAALTTENWGGSWVTEPAHDGYRRIHTEHLAAIRSAVEELQAVADRLRRTADRYDRAEEDSAAAG
jgi:uncharacterized protein YukE